MSTVSKLQIVLEASTTAFDNGLKKAQSNLQGFAKKTDEIHSKMDKFARRHKEALQGLQTAGAAAAVGLGVIAVGVKSAVTAAVDFEKSMAGVKKVIDFENPAQFKQMEQDIIALSQRLPMAANDIAAIIEAAGQSGIAREELTRFAESAVKMGVAFDITAEEAGKAMAEMRASFGMTQSEVETLADQINYLGNNSTNSAPQIMEVVQRIGSLAESANISSSTLAALSASMVGVAPEVAATSLKNFSLQLVKGESLSKSAKKAFTTMGLDYNQVAKDMQVDSEATIRKVLEAAQSVPEHMRAAVLNDAFGSESIAAISQLVTNYETVDKNLKAMGDSATYAGSMLKEFEGQAGTSAAQMQLFDNNIQAMKIAFGSAFLPVLNQAMEAITPIIKNITEWAQKNPELVKTITAITAGVLGAVAALGGLALAFSAITGGLGALLSVGKMFVVMVKPIFSAISFIKMFAGALAALGFPLAAVVAGIAAVIAIGVLLYKNWDTVKAKAIEVWNAIPEYANQAWQWIQGVWSGVGDWFSGIWDGVKTVASGVWESITGIWNGAGTFFEGVWDGISNGVSAAWDAVKLAIVAKFEEIKQAFADWLATAPEPVQEMVANIISIFEGMATLAKVAWDGITAVSQIIIDTIISLWQGLGDFLASVWSSVVNTAKGAWNGMITIAQSVRDGVVAVWNTLKSALASVWSSLVSTASSTWQSIADVAKNVWNDVKSLVSNAVNGIKPVISGIVSFFASAWNGLVSVAQSVWNGVKAAVSAGINGVKTVLTAGVTGFAIIFNAGFNAVKTVVSTAFNAIKALVRGDINGVKTTIQSGLSQLAGIARNAMGQMVSAVLSVGARLRQAGGEIVQGLINGISDKIGSAVAKVRELATRMKNAVTGFFDIRSPSRVMKQIGEWVSEGLALGVAAKAPLAAKEAKKLAEATKKAFDDEIKSLDRNILVNKLKLQGNPYAEFAADVAMGKYGDPNNQSALQSLFDKKQQDIDLSKQIKGLEEYNSKIDDINRQIAMIGNTSKVQEFLYDVAQGSNLTEKQVIGIINALRQLEEAESQFKLDTELKKSNDALERHLFLLDNAADKYAEMRYDLATQGFSQSAIDQIVSNQQKIDAANQFSQLSQDAITRLEDPVEKLKREYNEKIAIITAEEARIGMITEHTLAVRKLAQEDFAEKSLDLEIKAYEEKSAIWSQGLTLVSGVWDKMTEIVKDAYGEQSVAAKIMFAGQKAIAIAQAIINTELAATKALAEGGPIAGIPMANMVRAAGYASIGLMAGQTISNLAGQAHSGIANVPREGTWILDKGERVLPQHTAKALDDKLDKIGNGGRPVNVVINNYSGEKTDVQQMPNGDMMVTIGKMISHTVDAKINQRFIQARRQGGELYGR